MRKIMNNIDQRFAGYASGSLFSRLLVIVVVILISPEHGGTL